MVLFGPLIRTTAVFLNRAVADYIPNDTALGGDAPGMIILTGPNMGGKSTLLRQVCALFDSSATRNLVVPHRAPLLPKT